MSIESFLERTIIKNNIIGIGTISHSACHNTILVLVPGTVPRILLCKAGQVNVH